MDKWGRPISEYRGEFTWNFKEGFSREGRRLKPDDRLSTDMRQLRLLKKKEQAEEELKRAREMAQHLSEGNQLPVVVDRHGEEYEVCETAKEAVERLIKSDPRLASKYQNYIKNIESKLKPYGTSYDTSFMRSTNLFPTVRAYEMAAEEFEKNQDVFETPARNRDRQVKKAAIKNDWTSKLTNYGKPLGDEATYDCSYGTGMTSRSEDSEYKDDHTDSLRETSISNGGDSLRQRWVDRAHQELTRKFSADPRATEEQRKRDSCEVPLWFRRGLERKGLI